VWEYGKVHVWSLSKFEVVSSSRLGLDKTSIAFVVRRSALCVCALLFALFTQREHTAAQKDTKATKFIYAAVCEIFPGGSSTILYRIASPILWTRTNKHRKMSGFVDPIAPSVEYLEHMATQSPDLAETFFTPMAAACRAKLWHQLTMKVMEFATSSHTKKAVPPQTFLELFDKVVLPFNRYLNGLAVSQIASFVASALLPTDPTAARTVLEEQVRRAKKDMPHDDSDEATQSASDVPRNEPTPALLFAEAKLLTLQLALMSSLPTTGTTPASADTAEIKSSLKGQKFWLKAMEEASPAAFDAVHAAHYEAAMAYYKLVGPPQAFYEQGMAFLQYAPPFSDAATHASTDYHRLAIDLVLAALTGEGVYNLGQVEQNPVLQVLQGTPDAWLLEILSACASGDVTRFGKVTQTYSKEISTQPALLNRSNAVEEKMKLLALVWLVFSKPPHERTLSFEEIATALQVPTDQVEWVLMRAMSVELLKGEVDQVDQTVHITWLLPRVLNQSQIKDLAARIGTWAETVQTTHKDVQQQATPVLG
jgi:26S proteasome regulatory subunit N9